MKETGILYSAPMVLATLAGRKDVTRRTRGLEKINERPNAWHYDGENIDGDHLFFNTDAAVSGHDIPDCQTIIKCPYGKPGDLLYGRETHWRYGKWVKDGTTKKGRQRWRFEAIGLAVKYDPQPKIDREQVGYHKRPAIFLPKVLARIWRKITSIRAERLHEITINEAVREGVRDLRTPENVILKNYVECYAELWDRLNGKTHPWSSNPWLWRIESVEYHR